MIWFLVLFGAASVTGLVVYVIEWRHARRLYRMTVEGHETPLRRRMAEFEMTKATIDVIGHVMLVSLPLMVMLVMLDWVSRPPARWAMSVVMLTVPVVAMVKAFMVRSRRVRLMTEIEIQEKGND